MSYSMIDAVRDDFSAAQAAAQRALDANALAVDEVAQAKGHAASGVELLQKFISSARSAPVADRLAPAVEAATNGIALLNQAEDIAFNWAGSDPAAQLQAFEQAVARSEGSFGAAISVLN